MRKVCRTSPGRCPFGALGHSLGGHNAIFTAVFDPRLKVVVSSCGFDPDCGHEFPPEIREEVYRFLADVLR